MNRELISVIDEIGRQKGIDKARVIGAIESALQTAAKKRFGQAENIQVEIDPKTGEISVVSKKIIVETVTNPKAEISLKEARRIRQRGRSRRRDRLADRDGRIGPDRRTNREAGHFSKGARGGMGSGAERIFDPPGRPGQRDYSRAWNGGIIWSISERPRPFCPFRSRFREKPIAAATASRPCCLKCVGRRKMCKSFSPAVIRSSWRSCLSWKCRKSARRSSRSNRRAGAGRPDEDRGLVA